MKKIAILLIMGLLILLIPAIDCHAGPWTLEKGKTWIEMFSRYSYSKECFGPHGNRSRWNNGGFQETYDLEGKVEYGVADNFNLLLSVPYTWTVWKDDYVLHNGTPALKHEGFKEINLGGKYLFLKDPLVTAVQLKAFIYPYSDRNKEPQLSEYGNALEGRLLIGKAFNISDHSCYFSAESGYKLRSKRWIAESDWADTIPIFGEAGFAPFDWLMIKGEIDCSISVPGTGRVKDTYTWRVGPIISLFGRGFSSIEKGAESSLNIELQYGQTFAGRGDPDIQKNPTWPNSDDRVGAAHEFICKVQLLF